jgi:hypothetical protein
MPDTRHPLLQATAHRPGIPSGVPRDYAVAVPDSWALIPLEPGVREKAIGVLIRRQFAGTPSTSGAKAALRRHLTDLAEAARQTGGIELYLSLMKAGPVPLAASLLITLIPPSPSGPVPAQAVAEEAKKRNRSVRIMQLAAGTCVRVETSAAGLSFYFCVPGSGAWLLLAFAGPDWPLGPAMKELFEAIAGTLRWVG